MYEQFRIRHSQAKTSQEEDQVLREFAQFIGKPEASRQELISLLAADLMRGKFNV